MIGRTSGASRFIVDNFLMYWVAKYGEGHKKERIVHALIYFEPVQRFEYRGDMFSLGVSVTARAREFCSNWR